MTARRKSSVRCGLLGWRHHRRVLTVRGFLEQCSFCNRIWRKVPARQVSAPTHAVLLLRQPSRVALVQSDQQLLGDLPLVRGTKNVTKAVRQVPMSDSMLRCLFYFMVSETKAMWLHDSAAAAQKGITSARTSVWVATHAAQVSRETVFTLLTKKCTERTFDNIPICFPVGEQTKNFFRSPKKSTISSPISSAILWNWHLHHLPTSGTTAQYGTYTHGDTRVTALVAQLSLFKNVDQRRRQLFAAPCGPSSAGRVSQPVAVYLLALFFSDVYNIFYWVFISFPLCTSSPRYSPRKGGWGQQCLVRLWIQILHQSTELWKKLTQLLCGFLRFRQ